MPYLRCPGCGLLAHVHEIDQAAIHCPRCRTDEQSNVLQPLEQSLHIAEEPGEHPKRAG
jgi:hypothetical protein